MKYDIVLAGVGGQGILTIAIILDRAAHASGLYFKQCEVHGMSQRGGAVESHVRISSQEIHSDLIPESQADLILSTEPLEALRYLSFLKPEGRIITSTAPFRNIATYPDEQQLLAALKALPNCTLIDTTALCQQAGNPRSQNLIMLGAALPHIDLPVAAVEQEIQNLFASKSEPVRSSNLTAFRLGMEQTRPQLS
jgi:indolepyruvate ferredoxin oxidoreductase beta subunit